LNTAHFSSNRPKKQKRYNLYGCSISGWQGQKDLNYKNGVLACFIQSLLTLSNPVFPMLSSDFIFSHQFGIFRVWGTIRGKIRGTKCDYFGSIGANGFSKKTGIRIQTQAKAIKSN